MILSRQKFDMSGRVLIEKVIIQTPFQYDVLFQDEGCFFYFSGASSIFNAPNQSVEIKNEEAILLKCGSYFVDWLKKSKESSCIFYAIHFYPEILKDIYRNELPPYILQKNGRDFIQKIIPQNTLTKFIESLDFYFDTPELVNKELLELKIRELIMILIQTKNAESIFQLVSELFTPEKISIKEVINNHIYAHISIEKLAELSNMSVSSFKRNFKKIYNDTPLNYLNSQRLERAKELLTLSDATVSEIAYETGYADAAYFSRLFKKKYKVAPTQYSKMSKISI